jgi:ferredoxin
MDAQIPTELQAEALAGAQACPEQAIEVTEE